MKKQAAGEEKSRKKRLFISSASLLFVPKPKRTNHTAENQSNDAMHCTLVYFQAIFPTKTINLATLKDPAHSHTLKKILQCSNVGLSIYTTGLYGWRSIMIWLLRVEH